MSIPHVRVGKWEFIERTSGSPELNQRGRRQPPNIKPSRIAW
ncbi:MAG: hypothetical protein V7L20_26995 [Nostoc sp.]